MKSRKKLIFYLLLYSSFAITIIFFFFARGVNIEVSPEEISDQVKIKIEKVDVFSQRVDFRILK